MELPFEFPDNGAAITTDPLVRKVLFHVYRGIDFWTRAPIEESAFAIDHVWPKAKGGPDNFYNYVPTTQSVNSNKSDKLDIIAATAVLSIVRIVYAPKCVKIYNRINKFKTRKEKFREKLSPTIYAPYTLWLIKNKRYVNELYEKHGYGAYKVLEKIMADKGFKTLWGNKISAELIFSKVEDQNILDEKYGRRFADYESIADTRQRKNVSSL